MIFIDNVVTVNRDFAESWKEDKPERGWNIMMGRSDFLLQVRQLRDDTAVVRLYGEGGPPTQRLIGTAGVGCSDRTLWYVHFMRYMVCPSDTIRILWTIWAQDASGVRVDMSRYTHDAFYKSLYYGAWKTFIYP